MELIEGENVQSMLRKQRQLDEKLVLGVALQIARALEHAHKHSLVHRDIKPENIMITVDGVAKLCDLGLAKDTSGDSSLTQVGTCVGTPHYIAPEQARGEANIDIRADIYSLGASMFHMLIGEPVFNGPSPAVVMTKHLTEPVPPPNTLRPEISQATTNIILTAMEKDREGRYQTPSQMIADLEAAIAGAAVPEPARVTPPKAGNTRRAKDTKHGRIDPTALTRVAKTPQPSGSAGMIAGLVAVAVIGLAVAVAMGRHKDPPQPPPKEASKWPVAPYNHVEPTATASTQAEEDKAKDGLDVVEDFRKDHGADPRKLGDVIQMYEDFLSQKEFKFTKWALEARKRLDAYKKEVEEQAGKLLDPIAKRAEGLAAEEKYLEAAKALEEFPAELAFTEAGGRAGQARDGYLRQAREKIDADMKKAQDLAASFRFDDARRTLEALKPLCNEAQLTEVTVLIGQVEEARKGYANAQRAKAATAYDDFLKAFHKLLRDRKLEAARALVEKARKDPVLSSRAEDLAHDAEDVGLLEAAFQDGIAGAKKLAAAKQSIKLSQFDDSVVPQMDGDQVIFSIGAGATTKLDMKQMKPQDVAALAGKALDVSLPVTHFKFGLLYFFSIDPEKTSKERDDWVAKGRTELDTARKKDPRADRYWRWLDEIANAAQIASAKKLYDEAKESYRAQQWTEASNKLMLLLKSYGDLSFVRDQKDEIDSMLKGISDKLDADRKVYEKVFAVPPKKISKEGLIDITYDFEDPDQGRDWEAFVYEVPNMPTDGEWKIVKGEAMGRGHKSYYWKPRLKGDFRVEFTLTSDETHNLGLQFCDTRDGKAYRAALGYELQGDRRIQQVLNPRSTCIVRLDLAELANIDWGDPQSGMAKFRDEIHNTLDGTDEPKLQTGTKYRVMVQRVGDGIDFEVNGKSVAHAKDGNYHEGYLALWCDTVPANPDQVAASWDNFHFEGHLDPAWLAQASGK